MKRKDARENAFKVLFEISFSDGADVDETMTLAAENMGYEFDDYCRGLIKGVVSEKEKIDSVSFTLPPTSLVMFLFATLFHKGKE